VEQERMALLEKLGLHRRELRAWAMYEWAITGMYAVIVTAVFPIYFASVAAAGMAEGRASQIYALANTAGILVIGVAAPLLGAITDTNPIKKRLLATFAGLGSAAACGLFLVEEGGWQLGAALFVLINIGVNGSTVFYDALLPHVAKRHEVDRVSTGAFAVGYVGAGLLLVVALLITQAPGLVGLPEGTLPARVVFVLTGLWWGGFTIPLLRRVREPQPEIVLPPGDNAAAAALRRLAYTFRSLRGYREAFVLLIAYFIYGDGIGTIIRLAAVYGEEIGIDQFTIIGSIVIVQFVGVPATFAFGQIAGRLGAKRGILIGVCAYAVITLVGFFMSQNWHFLVLAISVGLVQGGTQALSRSLFASMIPPARSGEFFGFFGVIDKFSGFMGPALFAVVSSQLGSSRLGILSVLAFFIIGALLLSRVDVEAGRKRADAEQTRIEAGHGPAAV
jgi:MFS transporter, UMF1 family